MVIIEIITIGLICILLVIMTNPMQNKSDNSKNHLFKNKTRILMIITQFLALILAILSIPANKNNIGIIKMPIFINIIGLGIMISGLLIRILSMRILGKYYSTLLFVNNEQMIITKGLYGIIRHPIYLGDLLFFIAIGLSVSNYIIFGIITISAIIAYIIRIGVEEKMMTSNMGNSYFEYCKKTKKLIPYIY